MGRQKKNKKPRSKNVKRSNHLQQTSPFAELTSTRLWQVLPIALGVLLLLGCRGSQSPDHAEGSHANSAGFERASASTTPSFVRLPAAETGIDLVHQFPAEAPIERMFDQYSGAGVCIGDFDADDRPDVFFTNYDRGNRLYRNLGDMRFEDVTESAGVGGDGAWSGGATFVDVDDDGDLDLAVCVFNSPNRLYINQGNGTFTEEGESRGIGFSGASVMMTFADYDSDGDLDVYLVTHRMNIGEDYLRPSSTREAFDRDIIQYTPDRSSVRVTPRYQELFEIMDRGEGRIELVIAGQHDHLFENMGGGEFRDVSAQAGIRGSGIGLAATWWDYDGDGRPDLYVSNDYKGADQLYRNNGDGTFTDVVRTALPHVPWFSMGNAIADVNNDGRADLFASDMSGTSHFRQKLAMGDMEDDAWFLKVSDPPQYMRNALFLGTNTPRLMEVARMVGVTNSDWTWSPIFGDLDNDGWVDLFVSNGMSRDYMNSDLTSKIKSKRSEIWRSQPILKEQNLAFRNLGNLEFAAQAKEWGLDHVGASYGAAHGDLDGDGDLDLVVANFDEPVSVFRNDLGSGNSITVRLAGEHNNRWGIGAKVEIETAAGSQTRWMTSNQGFMSASEPLIHFGLGDAAKVDRMIVTWPNGSTQSIENLTPGRHYTITETPSEVTPPAATSLADRARPWFVLRESVLPFSHRETEFDDFAKQPLLPSKMSQQGPGLAVSDLDGDGSEELVLSGAMGHPTQVIGLQTRTRQFVDDLSDTENVEHLGLVALDFDSDGDQDLYAVGGSVESQDDPSELSDQLFEYDNGRYRLSTQEHLAEIQESGSCVAAADYDRDGDLDLFVGGRVHPGAYPTSPPSRLLRNDEGRWVVVEDWPGNSSPPLERTTGALWTDVDGDGWVDLMVTQQWGPVRYLHNESGKLVEVTRQDDLAEKSGWWNGLTGADLDGDGDIDYVVTNQGLNTKYHASAARPSLIYYGDVDGSGEDHIIEATFEDDTLYPERGRSCSTNAMPSLADRFTTFRDFALAELNDVYPTERLDQALRLAATSFESGVFLNHGEDGFKFIPLPRLAQVSPAFGVVANDFDGNGVVDVLLVHNSFSPQVETGRMDGGMGLLLQGRGDGTFTEVWPHESGWIVPGDAKSLVTTDLNQDARLDVIVGINNGMPLVFENQAGQSNDFLSVRLRGHPGNLDATGARVAVQLSDGTSRVAEVYSGAGYLSQSSPLLTFGLDGQSPARVEVRWPNGQRTQHPIDSQERQIEVQQP